MKILKEGLIYLIGELLAKILPFLMLPYLTRKLGPDGFGELSYFMTWLALFSIFIGFSQEGAITRYYYFYGKKALNTVVKAGYLFNFIVSAILLVICWLLKAEIMAYVVLAAMFQSLVNVQLALRQCQQQTLKYISIQFILSLFNVGATIAALEYFSQDLVVYRILAIVLANVLTFVIASVVLGDLFRPKRGLKTRQLKTSLLYIISFGLPLLLHQSSFFLKGQLDRLFIYEKYSKFDLGLYSAGVQIALVLPVIFMALNKAIIPHYYKGLKNNELSLKKIKTYTIYAMPLSILPAVISWIMPEKIYTWFLGQEYLGVKYYVVMYLVAYGLNFPYLILVNYFFYFAKNKIISIITFSTSLVYVILLIFTSEISIYYIPYALIFSNLLMVIILWITIRKIQIT